MSFLNQFIRIQAERELKEGDFLGHLAQDRTVTIRQLIEDPETMLHRLGAPWLDVRMLRRQIEATMRFFAETPIHPELPGFAGIPLVFFQSSPVSEDLRHADELRRRRFSFYRRKFGRLPLQMPYLHTHHTFCPALFDVTDGSGKVVMPLTFFSSLVNGVGGEILGYRMADYPGLLQVENRTASMYFIRLVMHDIGHGFMPSVHPEIEEVHNAVMLLASQAPTFVVEEDWEAVVRDECTNPDAFLRGERSTTGLLMQVRDPMKVSYLRRLRGFFNRERHRIPRARIWGFGREMNRIGFTRQVCRTIDRLQKESFVSYAGYR